MKETKEEKMDGTCATMKAKKKKDSKKKKVEMNQFKFF